MSSSLDYSKAENLVVENILFVIAACFIAAAGYLINDFYDQEIDKINHPQKKYPFTAKSTWQIYFLLNVIAVGIGFSVFEYDYVIVFMLLPIWGLWFYSYLLKRVAIIGNLSIAFFAIWLPVGVVLINLQPSLMLDNDVSLIAPGKMDVLLLLMSCSFLTTFSREVIKDVQDVKGDEVMKCKTFPVLVGRDFAMVFAGVVLVIAGLIWGNFTYKIFADLGAKSIFFFITELLIFLALFFMFFGKSWSLKTKRSSLVIKVAMIFALVSGFIF